MGLALGVTSLSSGEDEGVPLLPWSPLLPSLLIALWEEKRDLKYWEQDASTALWQWNCCPWAVRVTSQNSCFLHRRLSPCSRVSLCVGSKVDVLSPDLDMTSWLWTPPGQQIQHISHSPQVIYSHYTQGTQRHKTIPIKMISRVSYCIQREGAAVAIQPATIDFHRLQSTLSSGRAAADYIAAAATRRSFYSSQTEEWEDLNGGLVRGAVKIRRNTELPRRSPSSVTRLKLPDKKDRRPTTQCSARHFLLSCFTPPNTRTLTPCADLRSGTKAISLRPSRQRRRGCVSLRLTRTWVPENIHWKRRRRNTWRRACLS